METFGKLIILIIAVAFLVAATLAFSGWVLMLAIGVVHSIFAWPITVSFIDGVLLAWVIGVVGSIFNGTRYAGSLNNKGN